MEATKTSGRTKCQVTDYLREKYNYMFDPTFQNIVNILKYIEFK